MGPRFRSFVLVLVFAAATAAPISSAAAIAAPQADQAPIDPLSQLSTGALASPTAGLDPEPVPSTPVGDPVAEAPIPVWEPNPESDKPGFTPASVRLSVSESTTAVSDVAVPLEFSFGASAGRASFDVAAETLPRELVRGVSPIGAGFKVSFEDTKGDAVALPGEVAVTVDYEDLGLVAGGSFHERMFLKLFHGCRIVTEAETGTQYVQCADGIPLYSSNDYSQREITATITPALWAEASAAPSPWSMSGDSEAAQSAMFSMIGLSSGGSAAMSSSSGQGDFAAQPFSNVASYQVGLFTGAAEITYPIEVPAAAAGPTPQVVLRYSSAAIDGMHASSNNQGSLMGVGWSYHPGSIVRHLKPCDDASGHLCDGGHEFSMSLNGRSSRLVIDASATPDTDDTVRFYLQDDPYWLIERKTGTSLPDEDDWYWEVTTTDGTKYLFGRQTDGDEDSAQWVVSKDGCNSGSYCDVVYEWDLDRVTDPNGNVIVYRYHQEINWYGESAATKRDYVRAASLEAIDYTEWSGHSAHARVLFHNEFRCGDASTTFGNCVWPDDFYDTPSDLWCPRSTSSCDQPSPTFWTQLRLGSIHTQVKDSAGDWRTVALYDLAQNLPEPVETDPDKSERRLILYRWHQRPGGDHEFNPYQQIEAEDYTSQSSTAVQDQADVGDGQAVKWAGSSDWIAFDRVNFDADASDVIVRVSSIYTGNQIKVRLGSTSGTVLATIDVPNTGSYETFTTIKTSLGTQPGEGVKDLYLTLSGSGAKINWVRFVPDTYADQPSRPALDMFNFDFQWLENRVEHGTGIAPMTIARYGTVHYPLKGELEFTYGQSKDCDGETLPLNGDWADNDFDCFPVEEDGSLVAFNKWKVTNVTETDPVTNTTGTWTYTYGNVAWAKNISPTGAACADTTWDVFRGHDWVKVEDPNGAETKHWFYQGMNNDLEDCSNNERSVELDLGLGTSFGLSGNDDVVVDNHSSLQITGDLTYELWLRPGSFSARRNPIAKAYSGEGTITQETDGDLNFFHGSGGCNCSGYESLRSSALTLDVWTHVVLTRNYTTNKLTWYLNGQQDTSKTMTKTAAASSLDLIIGDGYVYNYVGNIDEVAVYDRALSLTEIEEHYGLMNAGDDAAYAAAVIADDPVSYWRLDETSGTVADDEMNTNDGTYTGSPIWGEQGAIGEPNDFYWLAGRPAMVEHSDSSTTPVLLTRTRTGYHDDVAVTETEGTGPRDAARFVPVQMELSTLFDGTDQTTKTEWVSFDTYGNADGIHYHGDVDDATDDRYYQADFYANTTAWIVDKPFWDKVWHAETPGTLGDEMWKTVYEWDDNEGPSNAPNKGRLTTLRNYWGNFPNYEDTDFVYDTQGRVTKVIDPAGADTDTTYDASHGKPKTVTNDLSHVTTYDYDEWHRLDSVKDANNNQTTATYNEWNLVATVTAPGATQATTKYTYDFYVPANIKTETWIDTSTYVATWEFVDGWGRPIQTHIDYPDGDTGHFTVTTNAYNSLGQLEKTSEPYEVADTVGTLGADVYLPTWTVVPVWRDYTYDDLGRVTDEDFNTTGTVAWDINTAYNGWVTTVTDPNGTDTEYTYDAFGNLTKVREEKDGSWYATTTYTYDGADRLLTVTDDDSNQTSIDYDMMGRKEDMTDPDMGTWEYTYDDASRLLTQTDGRDQVLWFKYDSLGRRTETRDTNSNGTLLSEWVYDPVGYKGLLDVSKSYTPDGTVEVHYDAYNTLNQVTTQRWIIPGGGGGTFKMTFGYDAAGNLETVTYPGGDTGTLGEKVTYTFDPLGRPDGLTGDTTFSSPTYASGAVYNEWGALTELVLDEVTNLEHRWTYNTQRRIEGIHAGTDAGFDNVFDFEIDAYDNNGNPTVIVDWNNSSQRQCFEYDDLDRLVEAFTDDDSSCTAYSATGTGPYDHSFTYDEIGNLITRTDASGTYTYGAGSAGPHAVTSIGSSDTYTYDANGNQLTRGYTGTVNDQTLVWDELNRLESVTEDPTGSADVTEFFYDADGNRVKRSRPDGTHTAYVGAWYEYEDDDTATHHYTFGGQKIALRHNGDLEYLFTDHLGSSSVTYDGTTTKTQRYYPWGNIRTSGNLDTDIGYTGQRLDGSTGLMHYQARYYDPNIGRFISADLIVPDPGNPQDLNRYSYVLNRPTVLIDPTGHYSKYSIGLGEGATFNTPVDDPSQERFKSFYTADQRGGGTGPQRSSGRHISPSDYTFTFPIESAFSPEEATSYLVDNCFEVFELRGCTSGFSVGDELMLEWHAHFADRHLYAAAAPVVVIDKTSTSFSFRALPGHPEGADREITFKFKQSGADELVLEVSATGGQFSFGTKVPGARAANFALVVARVWGNLADRLRERLG